MARQQGRLFGNLALKIGWISRQARIQKEAGGELNICGSRICLILITAAAAVSQDTAGKLPTAIR